jgi:uncharacterized protein (TIGR03066 family)
MRAVAVAGAVVALLGLSGAARAADDNKKAIVGAWTIAYSDLPDSIPVGTRLEFAADGTAKVVIKDKDGKERAEAIGGYKVDKDVVTLMGKDGTRNDKGRICLLNDSSFVLHDEIEDKVMVMKRVKPK